MPQKPDKLIIASPFREPTEHWKYNRESRDWTKESGRRDAGYISATPGSRAFDDPGIFNKIELVNRIRPRVNSWRERGYPGITGITKRLLEHWNDPDQREGRRFFFCQLEAIETLIWLVEAPHADKDGIDIPSDGGEFVRWCSKMATGTGKTIIMAMIASWNILNKVANNTDARFSKNILVVAPGITVKSRLAVLGPSAENNYYEEFNIVPVAMMERLRLGKVLVINWHKLAWDTEEQIKKKKSVDKRGATSDEAYVREVLGELSRAENIVVMNDEAHHAWRVRPELKVRREDKDQLAEARIWVKGLDRIHNARKILRCFDLSATPFAPSGNKAEEESLFNWIVSDFGLNDAIEAGLVKTPRVVIRDDSAPDPELRSRLYHLYRDVTVHDDFNRPAQETEPLPDLVTAAYALLGKDWLEAKKTWAKAGHKIPPVMITVANRTETAARIKYSFDHEEIMIKELCDPNKTLHIDSKVMAEAEKLEDMESSPDVVESEEGEEDAPVKKLTKKEIAKKLRDTVDTIGQIGKLGEQVQNVISVGMLTEGWDAKTVTHIMGLRAFTSQLLCEQVVGRGLRRTSYDDFDEEGLYKPEYVNIFGVPFTFLPHEEGTDGPPAPPKPRTEIKSVAEKKQHEIKWPNVDRIDHVYKPKLSLTLSEVEPLELDPYQTPTYAELASVIEGKPNPASMTEIDLQNFAEQNRMQTVVFKITQKIFNGEKQKWKGTPEILLVQLFRIIDEFISSDKLIIKDNLFSKDRLKKRVLIMLNMNKVVMHIWNLIREGNTETLTPVFNPENPIRSTGQMLPWYTSKTCQEATKTHINQVIADSGWEGSAAFVLEKNPLVESFVKNDHLGFVIYYSYHGATKPYFPDFIIRLKNGNFLVLEVKGQKTSETDSKRSALNAWCEAINNHSGFGKWNSDISYYPSDLQEILERYSKE